MTKFQVGDRVRVVANDNSGYPIDAIAKVIATQVWGRDYLVMIVTPEDEALMPKGRGMIHYDKELELVEAKENVR